MIDMAPDYDDLLRRGVVTATGYARDADDLAGKILDLPDWDRERFAHVLARALFALAEPGRVGQLDDLAGDLAEVMFDAAHENCDDEGCTGGGRPYYTDYVEQLFMPLLRKHAVPVDRDDTGASLDLKAPATR